MRLFLGLRFLFSQKNSFGVWVYNYPSGEPQVKNGAPIPWHMSLALVSFVPTKGFSIKSIAALTCESVCFFSLSNYSCCVSLFDR